MFGMNIDKRPGYRNSKSYSIVSNLSSLYTFAMYLFAFMYLKHEVGGLIATIIVFMFFSVRRFKNAPIYYFYDGGLGPSWKQQLAEDLAHAIRDTLVIFGTDCVVNWLANLFH